MQPHGSNSVARSTVACLASGVAVLLVAACSPSTHTPTSSEANAPMSSPARAALPVIFTYQKGFPTPLAIIQGAFSIERDCLVFRVSPEKAFVPIFEIGTKFHQIASGQISGIEIHGINVDFGKFVRVGGGEFPKDLPGKPASCPTSTVMIGRLIG